MALRIETLIAACVLMALGSASCSDDETSGTEDSAAGGTQAAGGADAGAGAAGVEDTPLYALTNYVFNDTSASAYVTVLPAIAERDDIELSEAREFPGWISPGAFDGHLFIASAEEPVVTRYTVSDDGALEDPRTLSFANYTSAIAAMHFNHFIDQRKAVMTLDQSRRILWDPTALSIEGEAEVPPVELTRDAMSVTAYAHADSVRADGILQSYYWHDESWYAFHPESKIAVYHRDDASLAELLDVPCPALHRASADEAGNLYFSPLSDIIAYQLLDENAPRSCVVRIGAGETAISADWPKDFSELVEGRRTGEFHYLRDGRGILMVYHDERATITAETEWNELIVAENWRLWLVDLEGWQAEPIEELDWLAGGTHLNTVDGRVFLFTSRTDFSSTTVYEISADGGVTRLFETPGYAEKFVKVR